MKIAGLLSAAALTAAIALPSAAFADWSPTRWGMSPEQVIEAGGGKVKPATGSSGDRVMDSDRRASGGPFTWEGRRFMAEFYFDLDGGRGLRLVRLNMLDQGQCDALGADLAKRYGASKNQYHGEWVDPASGDTVFFSHSYKGMISMPCYLSYSRF